MVAFVVSFITTVIVLKINKSIGINKKKILHYSNENPL